MSPSSLGGYFRTPLHSTASAALTSLIFDRAWSLCANQWGPQVKNIFDQSLPSLSSSEFAKTWCRRYVKLVISYAVFNLAETVQSSASFPSILGITLLALEIIPLSNGGKFSNTPLPPFLSLVTRNPDCLVREKEISQILESLSKEENVLLTGPSRSGKTAVIQTLIPYLGDRYVLYSCPSINITAGTTFRGQLEARLQEIRHLGEDLQRRGKTLVVFIDEFHHFAGFGGEARNHLTMSIGEALKPWLDPTQSNRPFIAIGGTDRPEHIDGALRNRFTKIPIRPLSGTESYLSLWLTGRDQLETFSKDEKTKLLWSCVYLSYCQLLKESYVQQFSLNETTTLAPLCERAKMILDRLQRKISPRNDPRESFIPGNQRELLRTLSLPLLPITEEELSPQSPISKAIAFIREELSQTGISQEHYSSTLNYFLQNTCPETFYGSFLLTPIPKEELYQFLLQYV